MPLQVAQVARHHQILAQAALLQAELVTRQLAQAVESVMVMALESAQGPAEKNALVLQLWLATMGFPRPRSRQELLEHFLE